MNTLIATHCVLEPQVAGHAHEMFAVLSDPAIYEFENHPPQSEAWLQQRYQRLERRGSADGQQRWLNWVLRLPSGHLAGYVQATVLQDGTAFIAYELNSAHWRQGIGRSAVQAMLAELAHHHAVSLAVAVLKARNFRSEALLVALGFKRAHAEEEAHFRDSADEIAFVRALAPGPIEATPVRGRP